MSNLSLIYIHSQKNSCTVPICDRRLRCNIKGMFHLMFATLSWDYFIFVVQRKLNKDR